MNVLTQFPAAPDYGRERRFQAMFEGAAIGIGICGLDGRILEANPALSRMLGYSVEELAGGYAGDFFPEVHPEVRSQARREVGREIDRGNFFARRTTAGRADAGRARLDRKRKNATGAKTVPSSWDI